MAQTGHASPVQLWDTTDTSVGTSANPLYTAPGPGGGSGTGTLSQVASSGTAVTILAANTSRKGGSVFNDSTQVLYLGLSATTPTASVYSVKMAAGSYFEIPYGYTGILRGIWASANGNAVVTEYS